MESKRKNIYITIFVITTIVASCIAVYFGIVRKKQVIDLKEQIAYLKQENSKVDKINSESIENDNLTTQLQEKIVEKYGKFNVETSNCLNKNNDNLIYENIINSTDDYYGIELTVQSNKKNVGISIDVNKFKANFPDINIGSENIYKSYTFDKEISDIFIGGIGQDIHVNEMAFFILSDGTVEYMNIKDAIKNSIYKSNGKVSNLKNIVGMQIVSVRSKDGPGGYLTTIAFNNEGNFYDIDNELKK